MELRRRDLGVEHPNTLNILTALGELALDQKEYDEAEQYLGEAMASYDKTQVTTWRRSYAQSLLGACIALRGRSEKAEPLLADARRELILLRRSIPAESHHVLEDTRGRLADLYQVWGKPEKALALSETRKP